MERCDRQALRRTGTRDLAQTSHLLVAHNHGKDSVTAWYASSSVLLETWEG